MGSTVGHADSSVAQLAVLSGRVFGSISIYGQNSHAGAVVAAYSGATLCGVTSDAGNDNGVQYYLDLTGALLDCATPGNAVLFTVNGVWANELAYVPSLPGTAVLVNLTVGIGIAPPPLPAFPAYPSYPPPQPQPQPELGNGRCHGRDHSESHCHHR